MLQGSACESRQSRANGRKETVPYRAPQHDAGSARKALERSAKAAVNIRTSQSCSQRTDNEAGVRHEHLRPQLSATSSALKPKRATHVVPEIPVRKHRVHREAVKPMIPCLHPLHSLAQARRVHPRLEVRLHSRLRGRRARPSARSRSGSAACTLVLDERTKEARVCEV